MILNKIDSYMKDNVTLRHVKNYFLKIKIDNCPTQRSLLFNYKPKKKKLIFLGKLTRSIVRRILRKLFCVTKTQIWLSHSEFRLTQ